jgi:hypothetical protein
MMRFISIYIILLLVSAGLNAQEVTSAAGNSGKRGSYSTSWTLGEPIVVTSASASKGKTATQGFQQPLVNETILPIELLNFDVKCNMGKRNVFWTTVSEIENDYFLLLKSYDAKKWSIEASIEGAGNSNDINRYSYIDKDREQLVYYRLKQIDYNGAEHIYKITSSVCDANSMSSDISIYPNPVKDGAFTIEWYDIDSIDDIQIYNYYWQNIKTYSNLEQCNNNTLNVKLDRLTSGIYFVIINTNSESFYEKIVVE